MPVLLAVALLAASCLYLMLRLPLGIPGEWTTFYHTVFPGAGQLIWPALFMALFLVLAFAFDRLADRAGKPLAARPVAYLTVLYAAVIFSVVTCGPLGRAELVAPATGFNGPALFARETARIPDPLAYLADFPAALQRYALEYESTVRVNNNPPGATMIFFVSRRIAEAYPSLAEAASRVIFGPDFSPSRLSYAAAILGSWFLYLGAALAFVPACLVASRLAGRPSYWSAAVAMLAGSVLLFNPGNDNLQLFFFLWMAYFFLRRREGREEVWGLLLGLVASGALFFSLAAAVVVIVLLAWNAAEWRAQGRARLKWDAVFWLNAAVALLAGFVALYVFLGYDSFAALGACYRNHAAFYVHFPRTWWRWVVYNPWEFSMFLGGPLSAAVICAALCRPAAPAPDSGREVRFARAVLIATLAVMLLLNLSGKNSGEVNRLWVFFMPLLAIPACVLLSALPGPRVIVPAVAALQLVNVLVLRAYVDVWRNENVMSELLKYSGR